MQDKLIPFTQIESGEFKIKGKPIALAGSYSYPAEYFLLGQIYIVRFNGRGEDFPDSNIRAYDFEGNVVWEVESARFSSGHPFYMTAAFNETTGQLYLHSFTGYFYDCDPATGKIKIKHIEPTR